MRIPRRPLWIIPVFVGFVATAGPGCDESSPSSPTPAEALDSAYFQARSESNLRSLVVAQGGSVVRAEYFHGGGPDTPEYVWSVTKSVLALTVGTALDSGCLRSLDQTLGELLGPELVTDPAKSGVTLRHLLTMSSGIDFPEASFYGTGSSLYGDWIRAPDQVAFVMAPPDDCARRAQRFEYGSGTIHLASVALTRACGVGTSAFADSHLFAPLADPEPNVGDGPAGLQQRRRRALAHGSGHAGDWQHGPRRRPVSGTIRWSPRRGCRP